VKFLFIRTKSDEADNVISPFYASEFTCIMSPSYFPPLGLLYLGAVLEQDGHKVEIIDLCAGQETINDVKKSLKSFDAVGMSIYFDNYHSVENIAKMIKKHDSDIPVIIGGPYCTYLKNQSLENIPHADIGVSGEGEQVILELVQYFQGLCKISDIHGIYYRENNIIKKGNRLQIIKDLDSIPFPARHLVEKYDYGRTKDFYLLKPKFTSMITSRGCPLKCRFCARYSNVIKGWGFRQRSAENVVKEMQEIDRKYSSATIVDDNFLLDKKRSHEIMDKLIETGTDIEFMIQGARVDTADEELYKKMKKINVKLVGYGIESGNQELLDYYNKNFSLEQAKKAVSLSRKMGFLTISTFILGGSSIETEKHIENTIKFACSLPLDMAIFLPLYYQMGSSLWTEAVNDNKILKDEYTVIADSRRGLGNFTPEELFEFRDNATRRFYLRPGYIFNQVYLAFKRGNLRLLKNGIKVITSF